MSEKLVPPLFVRHAVADDAEQVRALRLTALRLAPAAFTADYEINALQPHEFWVQRCTPSDDEAMFVAVSGGDIVGMTGIRRGDVPKTRHSATIWGVFVHPESRGAGAGEHLVATAVSWARTHQVRVVKLGVATWNSAALRTYERVGFTVYGTEPRAIHCDGADHDEYLMAILL